MYNTLKMSRNIQEKAALVLELNGINDQKHIDFIIHMTALKLQENKVWWNFITLQNYVHKNMIPQSFNIKKSSDHHIYRRFSENWNQILSNCSLQLMNLIIKHEDLRLKQLADDIKTAELIIEE